MKSDTGYKNERLTITGINVYVAYIRIDVRLHLCIVCISVSSRCWGSNLWHRLARNYLPATLTIRPPGHPIKNVQ